MVEIEAHSSKSKTEKEPITNIDITEIVKRIIDFVGNVREMAGKPMDVKMEGFNFKFSKTAEGEYDLSLYTKITIKPKQA